MNSVIGMETVEAFVHSDYAGRDIMNNLAHINCLRKSAKEIGRSYEHDAQSLELGAYFHGNISFKETEIRRFLKDKQLQQHEIDKVVQIVWESQKESYAENIEGKILYDAHLLEGGKTFMITKSLMTGTARGQSSEGTLQYLEEKMLGKFECYLPELQKFYAKKEEFTKLFLKDSKSNL